MPWVLFQAYLRLLDKRAILDANRRRRAEWERQQQR